MTEKPILFSGPMVRAILDGSKTMTRRVVKPQPVPYAEAEPNDLVFMPGDFLCKVKESKGIHERRSGRLNAYPYSCPHGIPGGKLGVRETWAHDAATLEDCKARHEDIMQGDLPPYGPYYRAGKVHEDTGLTWIPSIHMPRWASRIDLLIKDIRVERLQEISHEDCVAEGIQATLMFTHLTRAPFARLWDSINAAPKPIYKRIDGKKVITHYISYPWEDVQETREYQGKPWHVVGNPYVWRISFEKVKG